MWWGSAAGLRLARVDAVAAAVDAPEVTPRVVHLRIAVDLAEELGAGGRELLTGLGHIVDAEADRDAVVEAPRLCRLRV